MDLAAAVAPSALARQRTLPVADPLLPLLPDGGLTRGRTITCRGIAATSLSLALTAAATGAGAWLAVVDVPWLGVEAAAELGVPLERLVRIASPSPGDGGAWADVVAAVLDGFEVVVTRVPRRINAGMLRRVQARVQAREGVLLAVGDPGPLGVDLAMEAARPVWEGVGRGDGHLRGRRVTVVASGRRIPRPRRTELWLPGPGGGISAVEPAAARTRGRSATATPGEPVLRSVG
jgi:hypothetical protein